MSHDRGCYKCSRDQIDYDQCTRVDCVKKKTITQTIDNIVNFPDNKIVREVTAVSFEKIQKFLLYHKIAKECGAGFGDSETVVFPNMNCFEKFCEKLLESK